MRLPYFVYKTNIALFIIMSVLAQHSQLVSSEPEFSAEFLKGLETLNKEAKNVTGKSLLEKIVFYESMKAKYHESPTTVGLFEELEASDYARAGAYDLAKRKSTRNDTPIPDVDLSEYSERDAVDYISDVVDDYDVVMINEAHHLANHRVLTIELLDKLWSSGFRYLAIEALPFDSDRFHRPETNSSRGYIDEPIYRYMIRYASEKGFHLIAYDGSGKMEISTKGVYEREERAAEQIFDKVFKHDESAKVVVHCGYGHIGERNMLGSEIKSRLKKDILTVSQTGLVEEYKLSEEHPIYTAVSTKSKMHKPFVLTAKDDGVAWSSSPESFDISVFWPRTKFVDGRPEWAKLGRNSFEIDAKICGDSYPCLIEVHSSDDAFLKVSDRVLITGPSDHKSVFVTCRDRKIAIKRMHQDDTFKKLELNREC